MKYTFALDDTFTLPGVPENHRAPDSRWLAENTSYWMALRGPGDGTAGEGVAE